MTDTPKPQHTTARTGLARPRVIGAAAAVVVVAAAVTAGVVASSHGGGVTHATTSGATAGGGSPGPGGSTAGSTTPGATDPGSASPGATTTTTAPPLAVTIADVSPAAGATVSGSASVAVTANQAVRSGIRPSLTPSVPGTWRAVGDTLRFTPTGAWAPGTTVTVSVPSGLRGATGGTLARPDVWTFRTGPGSVTRLQQLLATLRYLPLSWHPLAGSTTATGTATPAAERAAYRAPAGRFAWRWTPPATLAAVWHPGVATAMVKGAVMAFESDHQLTVDGIAGPEVWAALLRATAPGSTPATDPNGYTYALASKVVPEKLTVWHDGQVLSTTAANTGIPAAPTVDGTFPVYERLATQVMKGKNPDGSKYADPVAWVAYFNGGDAIHYIGRSSYGYPQSLGCVEIPYSVGQAIWPKLTLGTLVSVVG